MKLISFSLLFLLSHFTLPAQSVFKDFFSLPYPEKCWVLKHAFIAKSVHSLSKEAISVTLSLKTDTLLDGDTNGGQLDAFRHAYWMAIVSQKYGKRRAISLGKAHEKGNYRQFKKNKLEDGTLPDYESSLMDYLNNDVGIEIGTKNIDASKEELKQLIIRQILEGKLYVLKKNSTGNFVDCEGNPIILNEKKWKTSKCIVPSNYFKKK